MVYLECFVPGISFHRMLHNVLIFLRFPSLQEIVTTQFPHVVSWSVFNAIWRDFLFIWLICPCSILRDGLRFLGSRWSWLSTSAAVRASRTASFCQRYPQCNCVFLHHEMNDTTRHQTERQLELFAGCDHFFGKPQTLFLSSSSTFKCVAQFSWDCHFVLFRVKHQLTKSHFE